MKKPSNYVGPDEYVSRYPTGKIHIKGFLNWRKMREGLHEYFSEDG